jgi:uncharacterized membrane protein YfcA
MEFAFLAIALLAEIIGTVVGFGSSTIALPLALLFFDFGTALVLVAFLHIFGNLSRVGFFRYGLDPRLLLRFGLPSVLATIVGALLVVRTPPEVLKGILGLFLMVYVLVSWRRTLNFHPTLGTAVTGGAVSGFFAGLIGTGGALRGAFLTAFNLPRETYIATAAAIALLVDLTRLPLYLREGFLEPRFYALIPALFVVAILGSYVGRSLVRHIAQMYFRRVVLLALFLIGVWFAYGALT